MVGIVNFRLMHCNWTHTLNSQFLNMVANDQELDLIGIRFYTLQFENIDSQKYVVE